MSNKKGAKSSVSFVVKPIVWTFHSITENHAFNGLPSQYFNFFSSDLKVVVGEVFSFKCHNQLIYSGSLHTNHETELVPEKPIQITRIKEDLDKVIIGFIFFVLIFQFQTQTMKEDKNTNASPKLPYVQALSSQRRVRALPANSTPETRELTCKLTDKFCQRLM